ncbi:MAG: AAA family ATPase [Saprospiraceae bacterium]|nr:AAA family ATPase [Saprospiraceae bacterium]
MGYMGSGKSTIGKLLSEQLGVSHLESDAYIEHLESMTINEIFEQKGETYFRNLESAFIYALKPGKMVVSTGGGMPCFNDNISIMNEIGTTIYLEATPEILTHRLINSSDRPLLKNLNKGQLMEFIEKHMEERYEHYEKSHLIVDANGPADNVVTHILNQL